MRSRIVTHNVAVGSPGAFLPSMTSTPQAATAGVCRVIGAPGTHPVLAPRPAAIPPAHRGVTRTQDSNNAPTIILPSIYIATPECGRPPVRRISDNVAPVPAVNVVRVAQNRSQTPRRIGGRTVTRAARPLVRWPVYGGGYA